MTTPLPRTTSDTARLMVDAPSFAVGWQERILIPNPAAGQSWTYTVDGRYYERLLSVYFNFATSAVVANRFIQLYLLDNNGAVVQSVPGSANIAASQNVNVNLVVRAPSYANGTSGGIFGFLPDLLIPGGWKWQLTIFSEDAGDTVTNAVLLVQRFPNDAAAITAGG